MRRKTSDWGHLTYQKLPFWSFYRLRKKKKKTHRKACVGVRACIWAAEINAPRRFPSIPQPRFGTLTSPSDVHLLFESPLFLVITFTYSFFSKLHINCLPTRSADLSAYWQNFSTVFFPQEEKLSESSTCFPTDLSCTPWDVSRIPFLLFFWCCW